jgi:hypothetical protein
MNKNSLLDAILNNTDPIIIYNNDKRYYLHQNKQEYIVKDEDDNIVFQSYKFAVAFINLCDFLGIEE